MGRQGRNVALDSFSGASSRDCPFSKQLRLDNSITEYMYRETYATYLTACKKWCGWMQLKFNTFHDVTSPKIYRLHGENPLNKFEDATCFHTISQIPLFQMTLALLSPLIFHHWFLVQNVSDTRLGSCAPFESIRKLSIPCRCPDTNLRDLVQSRSGYLLVGVSPFSSSCSCVP